MRKANKWIRMIQIGFTYIGTVVGAGFASGQEIFHFITRYGDKSLFIIPLCMLLLIVSGDKVMSLSRQIQAYSYHEFNYYLFGKKIGRWVNGMTFFMLVCITGVMLAGVGALFQQFFGGAYQLSILAALVFVYLVTARGMEALVTVNMIVVPVMIFFNILIGLKTFLHAGPVTYTALNHTAGWAVSPFLYASFNITLAFAVLVPLGREADDRSVIRGGAVIAGIGLGLLLFLSNYTLSLHLNEITGKEIPMSIIVKKFGFILYALFNLVILGEILTTLIGNVFGLTRQMTSMLPSIKEKTVIFILLVLCCAISQFGFSNLVHRLYPVFGLISVISFFMLFIKKT
ncbi:hypothetical protein PP175_19725 [Aneurinibacillus sp. Ricciae_BoGa-3]|uniref:YkvI family membrane protein n=1 Tax=Aneurinibacillus sp. Ricciae_BoGa-3 TaxID=3022697 RepID=UPI00234135C9|nr:hypothetical protein [Aneurinibacillus sp. Ricciae_BoGa-3]WCK53544.1 hypothetical protein PP175_19725 [Aneurinibacillus sp. Ricciae_BoGa-3]